MAALWWGTYPPLGLGTPVGQGEGLYRHEGADAVLAIELDAPSFVAAHPRLPIVYAASEAPESVLHVVDAATASVLASVATGGAFACHLLLAPDASVAYVSHYGSGDVAVIRLGPSRGPAGGSARSLRGARSRRQARADRGPRHG